MCGHKGESRQACPHAARRLERLQAVLAVRGEWLFNSNELQRSDAQSEPCNLPRRVVTQWVKGRNC